MATILDYLGGLVLSATPVAAVVMLAIMRYGRTPSPSLIDR
ncbi:hypothetical protein ACN27F_34150 [Solwaraspora sp. WMMB335]